MYRIGSTTLRWEFLEPHRQCPHFSGKRVALGHTPQVSGEVLDLGFLIGIDTDCSRGSRLSSLELSSGEIISTSQASEVQRRRGDRTMIPIAREAKMS